MKKRKESFVKFFVVADMGWDIETLRNDFDDYKRWVRECFPNIDDDYDKIWHNKVPFLDVPNGDIIAFDTFERQENCPIIYLSHDGSDFHGHRLAENFIEFINRWSNLDCIGTEDWQFELTSNLNYLV